VRAARCHEYGPPESIVVEEVPDPTPEAGQVVVDIHAASVNFPDVLIMADKYQISFPLPLTPGSEFAGVVRSVADDVSDLAVGDRVFGSTFAGGFAEQTAVAATSLERIPDDVGYAEAAAFGVVYATAYHALRSIADVQAGEWVVVLGAAGGVGLAAVDVARHFGARVLAAASTDEKLAQCREMGAVATVNYETEDLKERIKELTGGGADVILDPVGGPYSEPALRAITWGGRYVVLGFASGEIPRIPLNLVLLKGPIVRGFEFLGFGKHQPDDLARDRREMYDLLASGGLRPHVSEVFALDQVADALRAVAERKAVGKVIVDPTR
jgi:NADPH2:quinone reductase